MVSIIYFLSVCVGGRGGNPFAVKPESYELKPWGCAIIFSVLPCTKISYTFSI